MPARFSEVQLLSHFLGSLLRSVWSSWNTITIREIASVQANGPTKLVANFAISFRNHRMKTIYYNWYTSFLSQALELAQDHFHFTRLGGPIKYRISYLCPMNDVVLCTLEYKAFCHFLSLFQVVCGNPSGRQVQYEGIHDIYVRHFILQSKLEIWYNLKPASFFDDCIDTNIKPRRYCQHCFTIAECHKRNFLSLHAFVCLIVEAGFVLLYHFSCFLFVISTLLLLLGYLLFLCELDEELSTKQVGVSSFLFQQDNSHIIFMFYCLIGNGVGDTEGQLD